MRTKKILWIALGILLLMQLIRIDKTNPPIDPSVDFAQAAKPPADVMAILKSACYDCHSSETRYPWYTNVAPVSWWVKNHINEGRKHFDFSSLGMFDPAKRAELLSDAAEVVEHGEMPLNSYTWMHPEAQLSPEQKNRLVQWMRGGEGR